MKNLFTGCEFNKKIDGNGPYAEFDKDYIVDVRNYSKEKDGVLSGFLHAMLQSYGCSRNKEGKMYLNEYSVDFVLKCIRYFKKHGKWEIVK